MKSLIQTVRLAALFAAILIPQLAGAATYLWNVATPGPNDWNVSGNWTPTGTPGSADSVVFGSVGTASGPTTVNNLLSASTAIAALTYTNTAAGSWHVLQLPAGVTLTATGAVTVGGLALGSVTTAVAVVDAGTLLITGTPLNLGNGNISSGGFAPGTLDLSQLSNFVYSSTGGTIGLGTAGSRSAGNLTLAAASNSITAGTINISGATGTSSTQSLNLGGGTNNINAGTFNLGAARATTTMQFSGPTGGLRLRGTGGTDADRSTMVVGNRNQGGTSPLTTTGNALLNGHPVDMKLATLTLGLMSRNIASGDAGGYIGVGNFQFDQGLVDATTINLGVCSGNSTNSNARGTLTVGAAGTLAVGSLSLVNVSATVSGVSGIGTLNIFGGTATCSGNLTKTTSTASTGVVSVASGTLTVGGTLGSSGNAIDNLNLTNATVTLRAAASALANVTTLTTGGTTNAINVTSMPAITVYPAQFQVIKYSGTVAGVGFDNNLGLGTLPAASPAYVGYLSNNTAAATIDVVITGGPIPAQPLTWKGAQNGAWDTILLNWLAGATLTNYNSVGDFVTFDDTASTSTVYLAASSLAPGSLTVNNSTLTYRLTGTGKLSGSTGLTKQGTGTLIVDNAGANDFAGNIVLTGTLQFGTGGTSGNLPAAASVTNNGNVVFNRSDNLTVANVITGTGAVTQNGANTLTFTGNKPFSGGLTANAGTVRLNTANNGGTGVITINTGGTVVFGAQQTNSGIVLAGGTLGSSLNLNPLVDDITAAAGTSSLLFMADPQNLTPTDGNEMAITGTLHGSGNFTVATVTNDAAADAGNGFRLRGTAASDFSGTITVSNNVKAELQTAVAGPFSPAGTGKIKLICGAFFGTNNQNGPVIGGYSELNLRNNWTGDTVFGNDVEVLGTGAAFLDPLGTAPAGTRMSMGNLKISGGQELGVYLSAAPAHVVVFPTVTLGGGMAKFSPKTFGFGATSSAGSDLEFGNITQTAPSGLIMAGQRVLTLTGVNGYSGSTIVSNGVLALSGVSSLNNSPQITVTAGGILEASNRTDKALALISGQSLVLSGTGSIGAGTATINVGGGAAVDVTGRTDGTLALASGQTLIGNGTVVGAVSVNSGSTIAAGSSVGTLSTGPQTWSSGGTNSWEFSNATGTPGVGFDLLSISGGITIAATPASPFTVKVASLNGSTPGPAVNFNNNTSSAWTIAATTGDVTNFDAAAFVTDNTAVSNDLAGGYFLVSTQAGSLNLVFTNNHAPSAGTASYARIAGLTFKLAISDLLTNWTSDPDGDSRALVGTAATSVNGVSVTNDGTYIYYDGAGSVPDSFGYTIRDVRTNPPAVYRAGDTVRTGTGTVLLTIAPPPTNQSQNITGITTLPDGNYTISFAGIPGVTYWVQASTNVPSTNWLTISTNVAGANGQWQVTDLTATNYPSRFYRSYKP